MSERYVFPVAPGNADPLDIVFTFTGSVRRPPWEPSLGYGRVPRKLKKRLQAHVRRIEERELAMVETWWNARGERP